MPRILFRNVRANKRKALITELSPITEKELKKTMGVKVKKAVVQSFKNIVKDWEHQVDFQGRLTLKPDFIKVDVFPTGSNKEIWGFVDLGTKPHKIFPKNKSVLSFNWGGKGSYNPKTLARPARTVAGGGTVTGGVKVGFKHVNHPGTEARDFGKTIAKDILPGFRSEVDNAFKRIGRAVSE